jgi:hypothetical protein
VAKRTQEKRKPFGRPFQKGNKLGVGGAKPGAGRPSDAHRRECRRLVESLKIREFFGDVTKGDKLDFTVNLDGKIVKVPASIRNRMFAGLTLMEHGYGRAPQEIQHSISPESLAKFELSLSKIFQDFVPKMCPHCRTSLAMPEGMAEAILKLSEAFEEEEEDVLAVN